MNIVLKKLSAKMKPEDLRTLNLIEEAWKDIEKGRYKVYSKEAFFKDLKKWQKLILLRFEHRNHVYEK